MERGQLQNSPPRQEAAKGRFCAAGSFAIASKILIDVCVQVGAKYNAFFRKLDLFHFKKISKADM